MTEFEEWAQIAAEVRKPKLKVEAARRYFFRAVHSLPGYPEPWCYPHHHAYTVEIVGDFNHEEADRTWGGCAHRWHDAELNDAMEDTTVEALARAFFAEFGAVAGVRQVTVWEDDDRWGRATR